MAKDTIRKFSGEHAFLSNFYGSPLYLDRKLYPTVEHAYQASKTLDEDGRNAIRLAVSPSYAKRLGNTIPLRSDWEDVKLNCMLSLLRKKFRIFALQRELLKTGDRLLVEGNQWGDRFWGVCNGKGKNHLGKLLMQVRDEIRSAKR